MPLPCVHIHIAYIKYFITYVYVCMRELLCVVVYVLVLMYVCMYVLLYVYV